MKLFDLIGGKVVIHAEFLALPPIKKYWESTKDKQHATDLLTFIILCDYWNSPYVKSMEKEIRESTLKQSILNNPEYVLTPEEQACRDEYKRISYTRNLKMLDAMRNKIDTISNYYESSLGEELDEKKIQILLAGMEKVKGTYQTLDFLEKAVKAEEIDNSKVRGNVQVNPYELDK